MRGLRGRQGKRKEEGMKKWKVFEADGGAWKLTAVERIKSWLREHIDDKDFVILA